MTDEKKGQSQPEEEPNDKTGSNSKPVTPSKDESGWVAPEPKLDVPTQPKEQSPGVVSAEDSADAESSASGISKVNPQQLPAPDPNGQIEFQTQQHTASQFQVPRKELSFGAGLGIGIGIGCAAQVVAFVFFISLASLSFVFGSWFLALLIPIAAIVMMFFKKTRSFATGILIVSAAAWIVFFGPCLVLVGGFN